jgi:hypothetical protein
LRAASRAPWRRSKAGGRSLSRTSSGPPGPPHAVPGREDGCVGVRRCRSTPLRGHDWRMPSRNDARRGRGRRSLRLPYDEGGAQLRPRRAARREDACSGRGVLRAAKAYESMSGFLQFLAVWFSFYLNFLLLVFSIWIPPCSRSRSMFSIRGFPFAKLRFGFASPCGVDLAQDLCPFPYRNFLDDNLRIFNSF